MGKPDTPKIPKAPDPVKSYQGFIDAYLKNQPTLQGAEDTSRGAEDPLRIQQQQALQDQYGPHQYQQMMSAFKQLDPAYFGTHNQLANTIGSNLQSGGPYAGAYNGLFNQSQGLYNQQKSLFPEAQNIYDQSQNVFGQNQDLTNKLKGDLDLGYKLAPGQEREIEQATRGSQAARGNASGTGAGIAEAYALGDKGAQMYQQRLSNYSGGLGQLGSALGASGNALGNQSNLFGQSGGLLNNSGSALSAASNYNQQGISNAGSFLGLPSLAQQSSFVAPVSPDRSFSYINPNAGFQGVGLANQGYANQLGAAGLSQNTGGNPWMSAIGAAGSVIGGLAASGTFSDKRLKTDIKKIGKDKDGLNLYEFAYKSPQKHVGYMAQEVAKADPDAVWKDPATGYFKVASEYAPVEVTNEL